VGRTQPLNLTISGGVPVTTRDGDGEANLKILFKRFLDKQYLLYTGYSYYPINFYELSLDTSAVSAQLFAVDFNVTAINHYSSSRVEVITSNQFLVYIYGVLGFVAVILVIGCIFWGTSKCKNRKEFRKKAALMALKKGIDQYADKLEQDESLDGKTAPTYDDDYLYKDGDSLGEIEDVFGAEESEPIQGMRTKRALSSQ